MGTDDYSTFVDVRRRARPRAVTVVRGVAAGTLAVVVVLAALGRLGVHSTSTSASAPGWFSELTYASVARSGLDVPFSLSVHRDGG
ncbi:hypothetical protein DW322_14290 [Rhodococcus rhodnii]|uniref:Uncharacterized protein n=2 Tax=Rhodococcus rhodnii TaxID=38312 RepID=R7WSU3_9NOCA|nr:hypothetical protein [Rhodococcus rhodnii]EOM78335.1 hypothetical protein Rrhod_0163 [Rhodococcus rhodnii LMG 5362]TXG91174.1 hypothetical protein DW322_14290 [Rhodococcus rhodnii]